jgi:5-methylcytosine-specific restriction endonuclease McrA
LILLDKNPMQHIDKSIARFKEQAYSLLNAFIQGQWQDDTNRYVNLTYESFKNDDLRDLLLKEQNNYCCYCMKHILKGDSTLEHIIPQSVDAPLFDKYVSYGEIKDNVFFWERKKTYSTQLTMPPFPHILSYENLVASCNGNIPEKGVGKHCNNARGSQDIIPLFYIKNIHDEIVYESNGKITCDAKYFPTLEVLKLEHTTLQLFRRCWLNLPSKYTAIDVERASVDENLRDLIIDDMDVSKITTSDRTTIKNLTYWDSFVKYSWFYRYKVEEQASK